jgi:hypothetical protein
MLLFHRNFITSPDRIGTKQSLLSMPRHQDRHVILPVERTPRDDRIETGIAKLSFYSDWHDK